MNLAHDFRKTQVSNLIRDNISGMFYVRFRVHGRQITRSLRTKDLAVAKTAYASEMVKLRRDVQSHPSTTVIKLDGLHTVGQAMDAIRANGFHVSDKETKPRTTEYYEQRLAAVVKTWPDLLNTRLEEIDDLTAEVWSAQFKKLYSGQAANMSIALLKRCYQYAIKHGACSHNPFAGVERKKVSVEKVITVPTREQFDAVLRALDCRMTSLAQDEADLIRLMAFSGLRLGEARGLRWRDVDFQNGTVHIEWQLDNAGQFVRPKTWRPDRRQVLDMSPPLREHLMAVLNRAPERDENARVCSADQCDHALTFACKVAGVARMTAHDLRHLFATRSLENGIPANVVGDWLGHKDGGMLVSRVYGHVIRDHAREMARLNTFAPRPKQEVENVVEITCQKAV